MSMFDLVIVGAGVVGMSATFYALQKGWNICVIEHQKIGDQQRYWSSSFGARQNRIQYNQEYLTKYVVESNKEWRRVQEFFRKYDNLPNGSQYEFLAKEGVLWFGDKNVNTSEGNIKASNVVINKINSSAKTKDDRIESLYMEKLMQGTPEFMKAFKPYNPQNSVQSEWDTWSALYQPDGGSVNMKASYERFYKHALEKKVTIHDQTTITDYHEDQSGHRFKVTFGNGQSGQIKGKKILLALGAYTPFFLKNVMRQPYLVDNQAKQFVLQQYVASYIKVQKSEQAYKIYDIVPAFINFVGQSKNIQDKEPQPTGYGFRYHDWDNPSKTQRFVKIGTMKYIRLNEESLKKGNYQPISDQNDPRVIAANKFAANRMTHLLHDDKDNVHYPCPIVLYNGRQTLLDYLNRTKQTIVVQSGGWIGKYYPLLAKHAIEMLSSPKAIHEARNQDSVLGNFINRTRFPITSRVNALLKNLSFEGKKHFQSVVIGAGCSGLYAAYRLNKQKHERPASKPNIGNIGVFQLSDRISGRLKSFYFHGTSTPMELGGMRYIPTNHILVNKIISDLGIPHISFDMGGDPIQNAARLAYLRNDYYRMDEWSTTQKTNTNLHTAYNIQGPVFGMDSFQIICLSLYMIVTAPENINLLTEVFLQKTDEEIDDQRNRMLEREQDAHAERSWYRDWKNFVYQDSTNEKVFNVNFTLSVWNKLKPILLYRFRYNVSNKEVLKGQNEVTIDQTYPLYKFGLQNILQAQFGHEAYQFVAEQNGYYSTTTNASYLDQVMVYLLDFGKVSYRTLASGFDQINYALANILVDDKQGLDVKSQGFFLNHKLVDIVSGKKFGKKYLLTFHVALNDLHQRQFCFTKINHSKLRFESKEDFHSITLGKITPIEGKPGYGKVYYTADRVIFGMPRRSITNLINQIDLLREPIEKRYLEIYESQKNSFYANFEYKYTTKYVQEGKHTPPLTPEQQRRLAQLLKKQQESFQGKPPLTPEEKLELDKLSHVNFVRSIQPVSNPDFEAKKKDKFEKDPPITPKDLMKLADSTQEMPAMKIVMSFDRSWWDPNIQLNEQYASTHKNSTLINSVSQMRGVSVTDLPARQTLYFSSGADNLLLASYNDMTTTQFWITLYNNFAEVWKPKNATRNQLIKDNYPPSMDIYPAKKVLVKEILKQLTLMHQKEVKEEWVQECIFQFWGNDPYGAGYHNFFSGFFIPSVMKCMRRPWSTENFYFVGEAYSNETGWVEGAYQTTELMLQQEFKLPELVPGYYAGY